ncbi:hypothetical protein [Actinopolyspora halophila]|uniref:hypothetical protein n=1 Tax=Actinopolyspora halophila TaxID=1850 RepID=UPI00037DFD01|nr:hypothetical protein [Actinopolyspora halophila]
MEQFAGELGTLLLFGTPLLVLTKVSHGSMTRRISFAPRGSRTAAIELVAWLLLATLDSHTIAFWSGFANQPEDVCEPNAWSPTPGLHIDSGSFFDYPVVTRCVWPDGHTTDLVPWQLNAATLLLFTAAVAVTAYAAVRARGGRSAGQHTPR